MDTSNPSVPPHAQSRPAANKHPNRRHPRSGASGHGGLTHDNTRHTTRFTVIGNHLAQHAELSLLAIGLAVHLQSLPKGARVDIKSLAARFPEGPDRIAAALRELEVYGYLRRPRERVPGGRIVTRTISCNQPGHHGRAAAAHGSAAVDHDRAPSEQPEQPEQPEYAEKPQQPEKPKKRAARKPLPAVPRPAYPAPALLQAATDLLADLRRHDARLLLSACDTAHLAPGVAAWLECEVSPTAVRHALTADLPPEGLRRPAALLAHRLTAQLPPPAPFRTPSPPPTIRHPLRNCDSCDRAFRAPEPGRCANCQALPPEPF